MAVLSTILVILGAWCAASVVTAALYSTLRRLHVRRQRATGAGPASGRDSVYAAARCAGPGVRTGRPGRPGQPGHSGHSGQQPGQPGDPERAGQPEHADHSGRPERPGRSARSLRSLRSLRSHRPHRSQRPAHPSGRSGWGRRVPPPDLQAG
ncbi:hypothetical protein ACODT5_04840 [Streptomyces sp. 5.8]|uniref:hypothetical protein n=1 Tax=Streptomyces sp. 5.8 TaxID=3406571 RepID=UPI003BB69977